jgi:hypothetical protein
MVIYSQISSIKSNIILDNKSENVGGDNSQILYNNSINLDFELEKLSDKEFTIIENRPFSKEDNIILLFFDYFKKREIFLIAFIHQTDAPKFIRTSLFFLSLSFIFFINCLFFNESIVHKRYLNALNGNKNDISYCFRDEFKITIYTALIGNIIKMFLIKIIIYFIFKISNKEIKMMSNSFEKGLQENKLEELRIKRINYLKGYFKRVKIYFFFLFLVNLFLAYICICFGAVFLNSNSYFIFGFFSSYIMSFIFCMIACMINIILYKIGKKTENSTILAAYILLKTLY